MNEILVQARDIEEVRGVLAACLTYFSARDLCDAQVSFNTVRPSPLTAEIERIKTRYDSYLSDFLLAQYEATLEEDDPEAAEDLEEPQEASQELLEASEEVLPDAPLGKPKVKRQKGRRLTAEEAKGDE